MVRSITRTLIRQIHLYAGLSFGFIFIMLGLTGSVIAWMPELDVALNPGLFRSSASTETKQPNVPLHNLQAAIDRLSNDPLYGRPVQIWLPQNNSEVYVAWYASMKSDPASIWDNGSSRQVMIDPYTLGIQGERAWGSFGLSRPLLMPTLFHLHHYFLAGEVGKYVLGISGLVMLITTILGLVLWWPKSKWRSFKQALSISYGGSWPRFNYSSHRSIGFFAAPILLVLAISGVYFNFPNWVIPIVSSVMTVSPRDKLLNESPQIGKPLSATKVVEIAMSAYPDARISRIALPAHSAAPYEIRVRQKGEIQDSGATRITIDAYSGKILRKSDPLQAPAGDVFLSWQFPLHSGQAFGTLGKIFITLFGFVPLLFAVTGFFIWTKRRKKA